jgi:ubiquinone/menaquinone biosynthesis C-methylase UbiE
LSTEYLHYIDTQSPPQQGGAEKYHGAIATGYDAKREQSPKWTIEQAHIEDMLSDLTKGDWVLDAPCGTGRFLPFCQTKGLIYLGLDRSQDMLNQAAQKVTNPQAAMFACGDVRKVQRTDKSVDAVINCRITRWLSPDDCVAMLKESQRVARKKIIQTWRVRNHPHARSYDLLNSALDGWKIHRDEAGADLDYRIIELRPC